MKIHVCIQLYSNIIDYLNNGEKNGIMGVFAFAHCTHYCTLLHFTLYNSFLPVSFFIFYFLHNTQCAESYHCGIIHFSILLLLAIAQQQQQQKYSNKKKRKKKTNKQTSKTTTTSKNQNKAHKK